MKEYSTSERLKQIMIIRGLKQVEILRAAEPFCKFYDIKLNKNDLSQYISGKAEPGQAKLTILGLALNVSEAWLMGYDVPMEKNITLTVKHDDERTGEYVELFGMLSEQQQDIVINLIKGLLSNR